MIVLDTHAWVWWMASRAKLGKKAARAIDRAARIGVPAISVWEVAMKAEARQLKFDRPYETWIDDALSLDPRVELLQLQPAISVGAVKLPWKHGDPADRLIVATALAYEAPLATADERIHDSALVRCVWD